MTASDDNLRARLRQFRQTVGDAVGELRATANRDTYFAYSLEEAVDTAIEDLDNTGNSGRVGRLQRVTRIRDALTENIEAMKETPPESFRNASPSDDVNTPVEPEDE